MNPSLIPCVCVRARASSVIQHLPQDPTSFLLSLISWNSFETEESLTSRFSSTCCRSTAASSCIPSRAVSSLSRRFVGGSPWARSFSRNGPSADPSDWKSAACREGSSSRNVSRTCTLEKKYWLIDSKFQCAQKREGGKIYPTFYNIFKNIKDLNSISLTVFIKVAIVWAFGKRYVWAAINL